jgi:hypothetical protein
VVAGDRSLKWARAQHAVADHALRLKVRTAANAWPRLENSHLYRLLVSCIHKPFLLVVQILIVSQVCKEAHGLSFGRRVIAFPEGRGL